MPPKQVSGGPQAEEGYSDEYEDEYEEIEEAELEGQAEGGADPCQRPLIPVTVRPPPRPPSARSAPSARPHGPTRTLLVTAPPALIARSQWPQQQRWQGRQDTVTRRTKDRPPVD